jgi:hypothetical protein
MALDFKAPKTWSAIAKVGLVLFLLAGGSLLYPVLLCALGAATGGGPDSGFGACVVQQPMLQSPALAAAVTVIGITVFVLSTYRARNIGRFVPAKPGATKAMPIIPGSPKFTTANPAFAAQSHAGHATLANPATGTASAPKIVRPHATGGAQRAERDPADRWATGSKQSTTFSDNPFGDAGNNPFGEKSGSPFDDASNNPFGDAGNNPFGDSDTGGISSANPFADQQFGGPTPASTGANSAPDSFQSFADDPFGIEEPVGVGLGFGDPFGVNDGLSGADSLDAELGLTGGTEMATPLAPPSQVATLFAPPTTAAIATPPSRSMEDKDKLDFNLDLGLNDPKLRTTAAHAVVEAPVVTSPATSRLPAPTAPARPATRPVHAEPELQGVRLAPNLAFGEEIAFEVRGKHLMHEAKSEATVQLAYIDPTRGVTPLWTPPRPLHEFAGARELERSPRAVLRVAWESVAATIVSLASAPGAGPGRIRLLVATNRSEEISAAPISDSLAIDLAIRGGALFRPTTASLRAPDGTVYGIGIAPEAGTASIRIPDLGTGSFELELHDGSLLALPGQQPSKTVQISTRGATAGSMDGVARVTVVQPFLLHVQEGSLAGDGSADRPFGAIAEAIARLQADRAAPDPAVRERAQLGEIRLAPAQGLPEERPQQAASSGNTPWFNWWRSHTPNTQVAWFDGDAATARAAHQFYLEGALQEDVVIEGLTHLRIVNAAYAELRELAALNPGEAARIDEEYALLPFAVLARPREPLTRSYRLEIRGCRDVLIEGLFLFGNESQSGALITGSASVTLKRCIFAFFASGPTKIAGTFAVGRGLMIDKSGLTGAADGIRLDQCEFGWNTAVRKSVQVRAAALAVYGSAVALSRCYAHHNRADLEPADIMADAPSTLSGDANNHREANSTFKA